MVSRALGPSDFGNFTFITNFFKQLTSFMSFSTLDGFYVKLSQRPHEGKLILFYIQLFSVLMILSLLSTIILKVSGYGDIIWPGVHDKIILYGFIFSVMVILLDFARKTSDSLRNTIRSELTLIIQIFVGVLLTLFLYFQHGLNIINLFYIRYTMMALALIIIILVIVNNNKKLIPKVYRLNKREYREYLKEFYLFSHPLVIFGFLSMIVVLLEYWMLQLFGGSIQQGFYGYALRLSTIASVITISIVPILQREFAVSFVKNDGARMRLLIRKNYPSIFFFATSICVFLSIYTSEINSFISNDSFIGANAVIAIMLLTPIHQVYGQFNSAVLLALNKTRVARNIGIIFSLSGLMLSYFLIAPNSLFGLELGATGYAFRLIFIQAVMVNVQLYYISRIVGTVYFKYLFNQIFIIFIVTLIGVISKLLTSLLLDPSFLFTVASAIVYFGMLVLLIVKVPSIIMLNRKEVLDTVKHVIDIIRIRFNDILS